jgi:hypothetical protein
MEGRVLGGVGRMLWRLIRASRVESRIYRAYDFLEFKSGAGEVWYSGRYRYFEMT